MRKGEGWWKKKYEGGQVGKEEVKQHQASANKYIETPTQPRNAHRKKKILVRNTRLHGEGMEGTHTSNVPQLQTIPPLQILPQSLTDTLHVRQYSKNKYTP
jgi:hypothetical protein